MTKNDLVEIVYKNNDIEKEKARDIVEIVFDSITNALVTDGAFYLRGFGTFKVRKMKAKKGQNISKGITIDIPAKNKPHFKPSKKLVNAVN